MQVYVDNIVTTKAIPLQSRIAIKASPVEIIWEGWNANLLTFSVDGGRGWGFRALYFFEW